MKAYFVTRENEAHNSRWVRVLSNFFSEVEVLHPRQVLLKTLQGIVFSTPLDTTSIVISNHVRKENHIAISNALDIMGENSPEFLSHNSDLLSSFKSVWVDTTWAVDLLQGIGVKRVFKVPWGLYQPSPKAFESNFVQKVDSGILVLPRMKSDFYQPNALFKALEISQAWELYSKIVVIGVDSMVLETLSEPLKKSLITFPVMPERAVLDIIAKASAVLMGPLSDGISVTILQSLALGTTVVSTPTIGAMELAKKTRNLRCSSGFDALSISLALDSIKNWSPNQTRAIDLNMLQRDFDLRSNVKSALTK